MFVLLPREKSGSGYRRIEGLLNWGVGMGIKWQYKRGLFWLSERVERCDFLSVADLWCREELALDEFIHTLTAASAARKRGRI